MSDIGKNALKTKIDNKVYENSSQAITGTIMNEVLQDMVDTLADGGNLDAGSVNTANIADGAVTDAKLQNPVSVSQNIQTGHTNINIGGTDYPVASVEDANYNVLFNKTAVATYPGFDYTNEVKELYVKDNPAPISFWVMENGRCILWYQGDGVDVGCRTDAVIDNNIIYPLVVYYGATEQYPVGTIMGYVIMKDIESAKQHSQGVFRPNINFAFANKLSNFPQISSYLGQSLYKNKIKQSNIGDSDVLFPFSVDVYENDVDYTPDIDELYIVDALKTSTKVGLFYNNAYEGSASLFFTINNKTYGARSDSLSTLTNGNVCPIRVYYNTDETFPLNMIVGYVVFRDKTSFATKEASIDNNVNIKYCCNIKNALKIASYLGVTIKDGAVTESKLAYGSMLFALKDTTPAANYPNYFDDIKELYLPVDLSQVEDLSIWCGDYNSFIWFKHNNIQIGARGDRPNQNDKIYPISIYYNADETYPMGTIIGYVVFKDYQHFINNTFGALYPGGNINYPYCSNIKNAPQVAKYLQYYSDGTPTEFVPNLRLPSKIYAVVGDTIQLFYREILDTWTITNYKIRCICSVGKSYPRYFEYTPTADNIGETTLQIQVLNQIGEVITSGTTTLKTVAVGNSPATDKKVFIFGDSLTVGGQWPVEMKRRLTGTGGSPSGDSKSNISFCGSMSSNGTNYFGWGGWSWRDYITKGRAGFRFYVTGVNQLSLGAVYSNNGHNYTIIEINVTEGTGNIRCEAASFSDTPSSSGTLTKVSGNGDSTITFNSYSEDSQNPLWDDDNQQFTFIPYANEYGDGQIDVVYTLLTWNALPNESITGTNESTFDTIKGYVKTFADKLHSEFPNAKLKLIGLQCPSLDGGYTANYGAGEANWVVDFHGLKNAFFYNKMLQTFANSDGYSSWVEFVDAGFQFDSEYGEQYTMKAVNTRMPSVTEKVGTNGVHPSTAGYMMFADAAYRNFIANFCQ